MTKEIRLGLTVGVLVAASSIATNLIRGDAQAVAVYPGALTALMAPLVVYRFIVDRSREDRAVPPVDGWRAGAIAGALFAAVLVVFSMWRLERFDLSLAAFLATVAFGATTVLCWASTAVARRRARRTLATPEFHGLGLS